EQRDAIGPTHIVLPRIGVERDDGPRRVATEAVPLGIATWMWPVARHVGVRGKAHAVIVASDKAVPCSSAARNDSALPYTTRKSRSETNESCRTFPVGEKCAATIARPPPARSVS